MKEQLSRIVTNDRLPLHFRAVAAIWRHNLEYGVVNKKWPALFGLSGAGKSYAIQQLGKMLGMKVIPLRLHMIREEELGGYPRPIEVDNGNLVMGFIPMQHIYEAMKEPVILVLEEFDKAREEIQSTALELLWDHSVNRMPLHPQTLKALVMQPPAIDWNIWSKSAAGDAIITRMVWLPVNPDYDTLKGKIFDLSFLKSIYEEELKYPPLRGRMRNYWVIEFLEAWPDILLDRHLTYYILRGVLEENVVKKLLEQPLDVPLDYENIVKNENLVRMIIDSRSLMHLPGIFAYGLFDMKKELWAEVVDTIIELDSTNTLIGECLTKLRNAAIEKINKYGSSTPVGLFGYRYVDTVDEIDSLMRFVSEQFEKIKQKMEYNYENIDHMVEIVDKTKEGKKDDK